LQTSRTTIVRAAVGAKSAQVTVTAVTLPTVTITVAGGGIGGGQPEAGQPVTFTVTPSTATTGNQLRNVVIDFGDGQQENLGAISGPTQVSHVYGRPGTYRVTATATDIQNLTGTSSLVINVSDRSPITLTLTASAPANRIVEFTANASGATGLTYFWDFGDGTSAVTTGGITNHRYSASGTYIARVTARSATGQEGSAERTVVIP
jgi:PKD repeat protein